MIVKYILIGLCGLLAAMLTGGCTDELKPPFEDIPEGISTFEAEVGFKDFTPTLGSRAPGQSIKKINTLWVVAFDKDGNYLDRYHITDFTVGATRPNPLPDGSDEYEEAATGTASFKLTLRNGYYKLYAVANHDLDGYTFATEDDLLGISLAWQEGDASKNAQMLGYFAEGGRGDDSADLARAPVVAVRGAATALHAWLRRAASKVTIAFDTTNLREHIYIYIRSVAIRDIPRRCFLGKTNTPGSTEGATRGGELMQGEVIYLNEARADHDYKTDHGKWKMIASGDSIYGLQSEAKGELNRGTSLEKRLAYEHADDAPALFFFENMQGQGKHGTASDKRQDVGGYNSSVSYPDGNTAPDPNNPNATDPNTTGWKDAKPFGSYIEVDGYYVNNDSIRPGRGAIKYRFMLGKDEEIDYDAERNHHYRLTMKFNNHANDIDWHIDYVKEESPGFTTPDTAYVSYSYNQPATLVARATPRPGYDLVKITAVILDNEWRPHLDKSENPADFYNKTAWDWQVNGSGNYARPSDYPVLDPECAKNCEFGFLSLRSVEIVTRDFGGQGDQAGLVKKLRDYYFYPQYRDDGTPDTNGPKGKREYGGKGVIPTTDTGTKGLLVTDEIDGNYTIHRTTDKFTKNKVVDYVFTLPMYTRAKSLDNWAVYSGANAFYEHHRYARVKYTAHFEKIDPSVSGPQTYEQNSYTTVLQARRIDNPRGIYRRWNSTEPFYVALKYSSLTTGADGTCYLPIISRGAWSAVIERDPNGLVTLSKTGQTARGEGSMITGRTNTPVEFTYTPSGACAQDDAIGAIITVYYHNNTCIHKIIVRKGYAAHKIGASEHRWSAFNVYDGKNLTRSPLSIGSLFRRYSTIDYPILESNNTRKNFGVGQVPNANYYLGQTTAGKTQANRAWANIPVSAYKGQLVPFGNFTLKNSIKNTNYKYRVPDFDELWEIGIANSHISKEKERLANDINFGFGIFYADGAKRTLTTADAHGYSDPNNTGNDSEKGVRGIGVYSLSTGENVFFPQGSTGHPRRKNGYWKPGWSRAAGNGYMRYGSIDIRLDRTNSDLYRPMAYDLPAQNGASYWTSTKHLKPGEDFYDGVAIDFNAGNYNTHWLSDDDIYTGTSAGSAYDALPIKAIIIE